MRSTSLLAVIVVGILILLSGSGFAQVEESGIPENVDPGITVEETASEQAGVTANTTYSIDDFGIISVVDTWSGLAQESGKYLYVSATRELGRIPVRVKDHRFTISFATKSYLIEDEEDYQVLYFRTPTFFYEDGPISVNLTIDLGNRLSYVEMMANSPEPSSIEGNTLSWEIPQAGGVTLFLKLMRSSAFLVPGEGGPQFDPRLLPNLSSSEIPKNADEALRELETIILVAENEGTADPDFIKLLRKSLSKLYYLYYLYGLVTDFAPDGSDG